MVTMEEVMAALDAWQNARLEASRANIKLTDARLRFEQLGDEWWEQQKKGGT